MHSTPLLVCLAMFMAACSERSPPPEPSTSARISEAPNVVVPDEVLIDQDGREVDLRALLSARAVAVNFIFTTCTTICSPMTAVFARLSRSLGPALGRDVRLVSISLDPETDTPDKLRAYADRFDRLPGWTFLTGPKERVSRVQKALGGSVKDKAAHTPITVIGSLTQGRFQRVDGLASASELGAWLRPWWAP